MFVHRSLFSLVIAALIAPAAFADSPPSDLVDYVKKAFSDGADLIKQKGDAGMSDLYVDPFSGQQARFSDGAWAFLEHSGEHYGQLVVYYRVAGLVPPESRPKK